MKQLLSLPLFLFLVPCLAWAQYPSNGNQKITLGEQTTADGLIYRGVLGDTALITPLSDTSAYIILDTANHRFYNYNRATNVWSVAGGGTSVTTFSGGTTGLTPSDATSGAVTLGGTLAVANGGTGSATQNFVDLTNTQTVAGAKTFSSAATFNTNLVINKSVTSASPVPLVIFSADELYNHLRMTSKTGSNITRRAGLSVQDYEGSNSIGIFSIYADATINGLTFGGGVSNLKLPTSIEFYTGGYNLNGDNSTRKITSIDSLGRVKIGDTNNYAVASEKLHVIGNGRFTAVGAGAYSNDLNITSTGVLTTASSSDETFKYNINPITYGLSTILQLKPVSFQWKKGDEYDLGFIAQDAVNIIPEAVDTFWDSSLLFRSNTIIPILTKAIQEQNALIKALEQRIINLENK
jgi:hypothetical protein